MIELYQFPPNKRTISYSPYCLKLETYLKMTKLPYKTVVIVDPRKAPKQKLPFIDDSGTRIADSGLVIDYLKKKYGDPLDKNLSVEQQSLAHAIRRMIEEHLIYGLAYSRWIDPPGWQIMKPRFFRGMPAVLQMVIPQIVQRKFVSRMKSLGLTAHTRDEIYDLAKQDVSALSVLLGDKLYMLGENPSSIDATVFGFVNNLLHDPTESPLTKYAASFPNFAKYCERMKSSYY